MDKVKRWFKWYFYYLWICKIINKTNSIYINVVKRGYINNLYGVNIRRIPKIKRF